MSDFAEEENVRMGEQYEENSLLLEGGLMVELLLGLVPLLLGALIVLGLGIKCRSLLPVLLVAFLLRTGLALTHTYIFPLPDSQADAIMFERVGWEWAKDGWSSVIENFTTGSFLYSWIIAVLYTLTDRSPLMIQGINVVIGMLNVYWIWLITHRVSYGNRRAATQAAWLAALWPTLNLYSALIMREAFITFFLLIGVYLTLLWWERGQLRHFLGAVVSFTISMVFHTGMLLLLVGLMGAVVFRSLNALFKNKGLSFVRNNIALGVLVVLGIFVITTSIGLEKLGLLSEGLGKHQEIAARDRAAYLENVVVQTPADLLWVTPIRVVYFLFAPFPWMVRALVDVIGLIDALLYLWLAYLIMLRWKLIFKNNKLLLITTLLGLIIAAFALGTSNYGTAIRHRAKVAPLIIITAVVMRYEVTQSGGQRMNERILSQC